MAETERKTKFVNRVEEFEALKGHLSEMLKGNGRFVVITGEAGMGKTRLVEELKNYAQPMGVKFYKGRCLYIENSDPYLPLIDALNQYFEETSSEKMEMHGEVVTPVGLLSGAPAVKPEEIEAGFVPIALSTGEEGQGPKPVEKINMDTERDKMFGTITDLLIEISKVHPITIFIDDLQWADTGTLQLIHYIARNIKQARVLLLGAYRPEDLQEHEGGLHPLMEIFQRMGLERLYYQINLTRLKYEHALELVKDLLQNEDISPKFMKRLYFETDGNPFFIEELCNTLLEEGIVKPGVYTWDLGVDWERVLLPNTIKDVISRRVAKLDETSKKILMYAAAIGYEFDFHVLQKAVEMDEMEILDPLDKLIGMKLIRESETAHETYMFEHAQIRSVVYESLSKSRLRIMHKKLGEIIEGMYTANNAIDDVVFVLARHFTLGKVQDKALTYNIKAGEKARKLYAFQEALTYFNTALQIMEEEGGESTIERNKQLIQLLQTTGELCVLLGKWDDAIKNFERIVEICERINDERSRAYAMVALGNIIRTRGDFERAKKCFEDALKSFEKTKDLRGIADAYRGLGYILWRQGKYDAAINSYNIAMKNIIQVGDLRRLGTMFIEIGNIYGDKGNASKCEEYYIKAIEELKKVNDLNELARAHNNLGDLYLQEGNYPKAIENFEKSREYAEKIGNIDWIGWAFFNMAEVYIRTGEIQKAKVCNTRAKHLMESINDRVALQAVLRIEGTILAEEGKFDEAIKNFNEALALVRELQIPYNEAETLMMYGKTLHKMGDNNGAMEALNKAKEIFEQIGASKNVEKVNKLIEQITEKR
ncbi:MAG: tetratricopeptide repeat protein [Thermoplasmata archaeon]